MPPKLSGRLGQARFLRLGWFKPAAVVTETLEPREQQKPFRGLNVAQVNHRASPRRHSLRGR